MLFYHDKPILYLSVVVFTCGPVGCVIRTLCHMCLSVCVCASVHAVESTSLTSNLETSVGGTRGLTPAFDVVFLKPQIK